MSLPAPIISTIEEDRRAAISRKSFYVPKEGNDTCVILIPGEMIKLLNYTDFDSNKVTLETWFNVCSCKCARISGLTNSGSWGRWIVN